MAFLRYRYDQNDAIAFRRTASGAPDPSATNSVVGRSQAAPCRRVTHPRLSLGDLLGGSGAGGVQGRELLIGFEGFRHQGLGLTLSYRHNRQCRESHAAPRQVTQPLRRRRLGLCNALLCRPVVVDALCRAEAGQDVADLRADGHGGFCRRHLSGAGLMVKLRVARLAGRGGKAFASAGCSPATAEYSRPPMVSTPPKAHLPYRRCRSCRALCQGGTGPSGRQSRRSKCRSTPGRSPSAPRPGSGRN